MKEVNARAVFTSLSNSLGDRNSIREAYQFWLKSDGANSDAPLDVVEVVDKINGFLGLGTAEKKSLMVGLYSSLNKPLGDLMEIPSYVTAKAPQDSSDVDDELPIASNETQKPAHIEFTQTLFDRCHQLMRVDHRAESEELEDILNNEGFSGLDRRLNKLVVNGSNAGNLRLDTTLSESHCEEIAHHHYLLLCELIGPVQTDIIYHKVVSGLSQSSLATDYDPRNLIA